jgi:hypothetical protein
MNPLALSRRLILVVNPQMYRQAVLRTFAFVQELASSLDEAHFEAESQGWFDSCNVPR